MDNEPLPTDTTAPKCDQAAADKRHGGQGQGPDRRESVLDRRERIDRRVRSADAAGYTGPDRRMADRREDDTGLERRRGPGRRRTDERRSAEEGEMTTEQFEFIKAMEVYKKVNKRMYPSWTEVLEVMLQLGYRKVEHRDIVLENVPEPELERRLSA
jgi:hypothetical protein